MVKVVSPPQINILSERHPSDLDLTRPLYTQGRKAQLPVDRAAQTAASSQPAAGRFGRNI